MSNNRAHRDVALVALLVTSRIPGAYFGREEKALRLDCTFSVVHLLTNLEMLCLLHCFNEGVCGLSAVPATRTKHFSSPSYARLLAVIYCSGNEELNSRLDLFAQLAREFHEWGITLSLQITSGVCEFLLAVGAQCVAPLSLSSSWFHLGDFRSLSAHTHRYLLS